MRKVNDKPQLSHDDYQKWKEEEIDKEMFSKNKKTNKGKKKGRKHHPENKS
jgi:hypothetical protein